MRRLTHLLVLMAFVFSCGGQWAVLQCVAWVGMIQEYSQMVPLSQAVSMTFSGKYPCQICKVIAEKKQSENSKLLAFDKNEKLLPPVAIAASASAPGSPLFHPAYASSLRSRAETPPTPPPRGSLS